MANLRFAVSMQRLIPFLGFHHVLMILIAIAIILLSLLLAGCSSTSPLIPGIFLISMWYEKFTPTYAPEQVDPGVTAAIANIVGNAQLGVRVGYFGICINRDGGGFICSNNATALVDNVSVDQDPSTLYGWRLHSRMPSCSLTCSLSPSSSPSLHLSCLPPSLDGTRSTMSELGPRSTSSHSHQGLSRKLHSPSSSSHPSLSWFPSYGNTQHQSQPQPLCKISETGASSLALAHRPWFLAGSALSCS
ncbi:hypothetical protein P3342_012051 [Pyrenophora teres f. teres]|nr:hypothetical protein P3342_012051 [Pyrenophora teres f. teres]